MNIVAEGGLEALFELLQTCTDEMTLRVAAGAIANLAMSEANQHRIVAEGGLDLLVHLARTAQDPQTQRMVRPPLVALGLAVSSCVGKAKGSQTQRGCTRTSTLSIPTRSLSAVGRGIDCSQEGC